MKEKNPYNVSNRHSLNAVLEYMNALVAAIDIFSEDEFCEFLHMESSTRDFLRDM